MTTVHSTTELNRRRRKTTPFEEPGGDGWVVVDTAKESSDLSVPVESGFSGC